MAITKVCVVGSGYLGTQIGVQCARHGYTVSMQDISAEALRASRDATEEYIQGWLATGDISDIDADDIRGRMSFTGDLEDAVRGAGIVIEAVVERLDVKREIFRRLDGLCDPTVLIATNSSSIKK